MANMISISGEKLRALLNEAGVTPTRASSEIGHADNFLGKAISSNRCSEAAMKSLYLRYGIRPEDYQLHDAQAVRPYQTAMPIEMQDMADIKAVVREAVYEAVREMVGRLEL